MFYNMDWQFKVGFIGLGLTIVFGFLQFAGVRMPNWVTWPGISIGVLLIVWAIFFERFSCGPALVMIVGLSIFVGGIAWQKNEKSQAMYRIVPIIQSRIISRLYARRNIQAAPNASMTIDFSFQELFYEWKLTLSADKTIKRVSGRIDHLTESDRVRVVPEDVKLSPLLPKWYSGFAEPARKKPDYFAQTFEVEIAPKLPVTITIRRPLLRPLVSEGDIIRISDIRSLECRVEPVTADVKIEASRLSRQAVVLAQWVYSLAQKGMGVPIRTDPGDVAPEEIQATVEAWCQTDSCEGLTMSQMEVHMGRSPEEWSKFGR